MKKIKVLLIENNPLLRDGTTAILNDQEDIQAVSSPGNKRALEKAKELVPDIILLDMGLKDSNNMKVLTSIVNEFPKAEVIIMDLIPTHSEMIDFVKAGVSGFISKDGTLDDLHHKIRGVAKGADILPPKIKTSLFSLIIKRAIHNGNLDNVVASIKLSDIEKKIIFLLSEGKSMIEISLKLEITISIVKNQIRNILDKLVLHTRLEKVNNSRIKN